ncbi:MAG: hypothetical protein CYPHOPRED_004191 [Cyphobasidiales sp. Tagirdzhanova-0007]|nr:MAG: hypothetical protein CYPHOPRED_004191 [Cyphobasidiales sp. Tagirdzhanova-0007]
MTSLYELESWPAPSSPIARLPRISQHFRRLFPSRPASHRATHVPAYSENIELPTLPEREAFASHTPSPVYSESMELPILPEFKAPHGTTSLLTTPARSELPVLPEIEISEAISLSL